MAYLKHIEYVLPPTVLTNEELEYFFPDWPSDKILAKTGIKQRHVVNTESASDLAVAAAQNVLKEHDVPIDYIIYCTQSPDQPLPTTACVIQERLKLPTTCGALDINLGCSGFVAGLGLASALVDTGQSRNVLLLNADTYTKYIKPEDKNVRVIFGDAGTATLVSHNGWTKIRTDSFVYGTDGTGKDNLKVPYGGNLFMNGPEIFSFTMKVVPPMIEETLEKVKLTKNDINLYIFHQANLFVLRHLQQKLNIPDEKFVVDLEDVGNTVSCTIPIAIQRSAERGKIKPGDKIMLVGFGVGYSWGAVILECKTL